MKDKELEKVIKKTILRHLDILAKNVAKEIRTTPGFRVYRIADDEQKNQFVQDYMYLCRETFKVGGNRSHAKEPAGQVLVETARRLLGYRSSTVSQDIFSTIYKHYCDITGKKRDYYH